MTKAEFIDAIMKTKGAPELTKKDATFIIEAVFGQMKKTVKKEGKFAMAGFGTFTKKKRKARKGRNPRTGETIKIAASTTVAFKPAADLKKFVGGR